MTEKIKGIAYLRDWGPTMSDVLKATMDIGEKRFRNTKLVAEWIMGHKKRYPAFADCSLALTKCRVSYVMRMMGWERYTAVGCRSAVFIDPRVEA
jgi:hypothetical protein